MDVPGQDDTIVSNTVKESDRKKQKVDDGRDQRTQQGKMVTLLFQDFEGMDMFTYQIEVSLIDHIPVLKNLGLNFEPDSDQLPVKFRKDLARDDLTLLINHLRKYHCQSLERREDWLVTKARELQLLLINRMLVLRALTDFLDIKPMQILFTRTIAIAISQPRFLEKPEEWASILQSINPEARESLVKEVIRTNQLEFKLMKPYLRVKANRAGQDTDLPCQKVSRTYKRYRRIRWSPQSNYRAVEFDSQVEIWKLGESPVKLYSFQEEQAQEVGVVWSPNEKYLLTTGCGASIQIRVVDTGQIQATLQETNGFSTSLAVWCPDGQHIMVHSDTMDEGGETEIWCVENKRRPKVLYTFQTKNRLHSIAPILSWSPAGDSMLTVDQNEVVSIRNIKTGRVIYTFDHGSKILYNAVWSPDGKYILTVCNDSNTSVRLFEAWTGLEYHAFGAGNQRIEDCRAIKVSWSPDGSHVLFSPNNLTVQILEVKTKQIIASLKPGYPIWATTWSPSGRYLMILPGRTRWSQLPTAPKMIQIWDVQTISKCYDLYGVEGSWSPDEKYLMTETDVTYIWETATGRLVHILKGQEGEWSPDSFHLLSETSEAGLIWEMWDPEFVKMVNTLSLESILQLLLWLKEGKLNQITENWETYFPANS